MTCHVLVYKDRQEAQDTLLWAVAETPGARLVNHGPDVASVVLGDRVILRVEVRA